MAVPGVNRKLLGELEAMGFPLAQATRALHYSGNSSVEDAINWVVEHENDPDIDQMPLVPMDINIEASKPFHVTERVKLKAQELRDRARRKKEEEEKKLEREREKVLWHRKKEEEEKKLEREREKVLWRRKKEEEEKKLEREKEKERIRAGKELLDAKRIAEENERKRFQDLRKAEKEEERRARDKIHEKLRQDKLERRRWLGLPAETLASEKPATSMTQERDDSLPIKSAMLPSIITKTELMRECLRSLKRNQKDNDAKVKRAFQTLFIFVRNVVKNPNEEKFRKIRLSNPAFQDRVGKLREGVEFLELCGFVRDQSGEFLLLPRDKVDMAVLKSAGDVLNSALTNPFFGVLSS